MATRLQLNTDTLVDNIVKITPLCVLTVLVVLCGCRSTQCGNHLAVRVHSCAHCTCDGQPKVTDVSEDTIESQRKIPSLNASTNNVSVRIFSNANRADVVTPPEAPINGVSSIDPTTSAEKTDTPVTLNEPTPAEPIVNQNLADQMRILEQIQSAMKAKTPIDTSEPLIDWEPVAAPADADASAAEDDSASDKKDDADSLSAKPDGVQSQNAGHELKSTPFDDNVLRNIRAPEQIILNAKPLSTAPAPANTPRVESNAAEPPTGKVPRLIAKPISALIHGKRSDSSDSQKTWSRAKFIRQPFFVPPSAIQQLPASKLPATPGEGDRRKPNSTRESEVESRHATPSKDPLIR